MTSLDYDPMGIERIPTEAHQERLSINSILNVGAAILAFLAAIVNSAAKTNPYLKVVLAASAIVLLLYLVFPKIVAAGEKTVIRSRKKRLVREGAAQSIELLKRFNRFSSDNFAGSIVYILQSASSISPGARRDIYRILNGSSVKRWLEFHTQSLCKSSKEIDFFILKCSEFTAIVDQFNRDYVLKAQSELKGNMLAEPILDQLEDFREEFNVFLRDVERWAESFTEKWRETSQDNSPAGPSLISRFTKVKTFRRTSGQGLKSPV
jgi:hypothetical protein